MSRLLENLGIFGRVSFFEFIGILFFRYGQNGSCGTKFILPYNQKNSNP
jgi:hypothetical protein